MCGANKMQKYGKISFRILLSYILREQCVKYRILIEDHPTEYDLPRSYTPCTQPFHGIMKPWSFGVFENPKQSRLLRSNEKDSISNRSYGIA